MIDGQRILAVCPARGGSKGIPLKNLQPFLGVPLVALVGHLVAEIPAIDRAIVSTDSKEIDFSWFSIDFDIIGTNKIR